MEHPVNAIVSGNKSVLGNHCKIVQRYARGVGTLEDPNTVHTPVVLAHLNVTQVRPLSAKGSPITRLIDVFAENVTLVASSPFANP